MDAEIPHIRIFPNSTEKEFETEMEVRLYLLGIVKYRQNGEYHIRIQDSIAALPPGSYVLFRFGNEIIGEAMVKVGIEEFNKRIGSCKEDRFVYPVKVTFDTSTILMYCENISIEGLGEMTNRNLSVPRTYFKIDIGFYDAIHQEGMKHGSFSDFNMINY